MKNSIEVLQNKSYQYRKRFLELFTKIGFGHVTSAFSWTEIATVLFNEIMKGNPSTDGDKFVISKGHGAGMLFPVLEDLGYFTKDEMDKTISIGGSHEKLRQFYYPGFDFYGGSLGMGLGCACGLAKGFKLSNSTQKVFCLLGDAECYEGSIWESAFFAPFHKLDNLIVLIDRNRLGCSDFTEHMLSIESISDKWKSFNWDVCSVDGHDINAIYEALIQKTNSVDGRPHCIIANTNKGQGLDYLVDKPLMHGYMPKGDDIQKAFSNLK